MNEKIDVAHLVSEMLAGYQKHAGQELAHLETLPDRGEVIKIIQLLRGLLFPGYYDDTGANSSACKVRGLVTEVEYRLQHQICRALNLDTGRDQDCTELFCQAGERCHAFLGKLPELLEILLSDVQAAYDGDPAARSVHEIIFAYPGILAISVYRLAHELYQLSVPFIPRMMTEYAHSLTGIDIHPGADIGHHFFIDHGTGIVIGETTKIGAYAKLYQGVTLGALSTRGGQNLRGVKRHPTLEDDVTVYSGASILGGETVIGRGSVIGGNVFITRSVPPDTTVNLKSPAFDYKEKSKSMDTRRTEDVK